MASVDHEVREKKCHFHGAGIVSGPPFLLSYAAKKWMGMRGLHTSATFVRPKELGKAPTGSNSLSEKKRSFWEDAPTQSLSTRCLGWKLRVAHSH